MDACRDITFNGGIFPVFGLAHSYHGDRFMISGDFNGKFSRSACLITKIQFCFLVREIKIFINNAGIVCGNHNLFAILTSDIGNLFPDNTVSLVRHFFVGQIAADSRRVCSRGIQRVSAKALTANFYLRNCTVGQNFYRFRTGLPGISGFVGVPMVKHVPLTLYAYNTAMIGACGVQSVFFRSAAITYISIGYDDAAIGEIFVRIWTGGVAKLMPATGRV